MSFLSLPLCYTIISLFLITNILAKSVVLPLKASGYGTVYGIDVTLGGQTFGLLADTGSSDLWVLAKNWKCYTGTSISSATQIPDDKCAFSSNTYTPTSTYKALDSATFAEHYGAGDALGDVGFEDVGLEALEIQQQEMAVVNASTNPFEDFGEISGILGLAYPVLGQIHPANFTPTSIPSFLTDRIKYPTVIDRLQDMGITYFAFAMERIPVNQVSGPGGYLSFGTLPPVSHGDFVTLPVEEVDGLPSYFTNGTKQLAYWAVTSDGVQWGNEKDTTPFQIVVDSGNWANLIPPETATKVNAAFDPPGVLVKSIGYYEVKCSATPPKDFGISFGGTMFTMQSEDMIWRDVNGTCFSSIAPAPSAYGTVTSILGDAFFKNAVIVFDYGNNKMKFAQQTRKSSSSSSSASSSAGTELKVQVQTLAFGLAAIVLVAMLV